MEVYVPVVFNDRTEGVIEAYYKMDDVNAAVTRTVTKVVGLLSLLALMVCAAIYVLMTVIVVRPLHALTLAARKLAAGEPGVVLPSPGSKDEIGGLRYALHQLI